MPKTFVALVALLASPCAAWHATTVPIARSAVRKVSMVAWEATTPDLAWAKMAWDSLQLQAWNLDSGDQCILIPAAMTPDRSRQVDTPRTELERAV